LPRAFSTAFSSANDPGLAAASQRLGALSGSFGFENEGAAATNAVSDAKSIDAPAAQSSAPAGDIVSPSPAQYYYWADYELARELVRDQNEQIAAVCRQQPQRLLGLGNVALQHPQLAVEQLEYAVRHLGLKGVEISSSVNGREIADASLEGFWAAVQALGCIVFIHPFGTSLGERVNRFYLQNMIGQPLETTIALSNLIFAGVLDRYPGVKILAAHGGGYLPSYIGRTNHGYQVRPEAREIQHRPIEYVRRMWFDNLVYEPQALRHLIDTVGVGQVVVGTDYPFDMGHYEVHEVLEAAPGLSDLDRARVLGGNALHLLGLDGPGSGVRTEGVPA